MLLVLGQPALTLAAIRQAAVYFSDGKVLTGRIALTPGRTFKLNIPEAGKLKTTDMITGEDVQYGKVRQFTFEPISEIRFYPSREEIRQDWKFTWCPFNIEYFYAVLPMSGMRDKWCPINS